MERLWPIQRSSNDTFFLYDLLAAKPLVDVRISRNPRAVGDSVSMEDDTALMIPLSHDEIDLVVSSSNSNFALGPDGLSISFLKKFWPVLKHLVYAIIFGFCLGMVDISRLNYAVISLLPNVKGADFIKLYRPIAFINNIAKFPSKGFATHLSPVAHKVIGQQQSVLRGAIFWMDFLAFMKSVMI
jgi:hypothetical protein